RGFLQARGRAPDAAAYAGRGLHAIPVPLAVFILGQPVPACRRLIPTGKAVFHPHASRKWGQTRVEESIAYCQLPRFGERGGAAVGPVREQFVRRADARAARLCYDERTQKSPLSGRAFQMRAPFPILVTKAGERKVRETACLVG